MNFVQQWGYSTLRQTPDFRVILEIPNDKP